MQLTVDSPFSVAITLAILGLSAGVALAFTAWGVLWRSLLRPQLDAKAESLKAKEDQIKTLERGNVFLENRLAEQRQSEVAATISNLKAVIAERKAQVDELSSKVSQLSSDHQAEIQRLNTEIATAKKETATYVDQLEKAERGDPPIPPHADLQFVTGIHVLVRNFSPKAQKVTIQSGSQTHSLELQPVRPGQAQVNPGPG